MLKNVGFPIFRIYDFNLCPIHKTALADNESSSPLSFPLDQAWWVGYGMRLIQICWLIVCISWEGEKVEDRTLQKSRGCRCQIAWVELSPLPSAEKWFNDCGGMLLPFGAIAWRSEVGGCCCDAKTTVAKEPWVCEVRLGSRWGQFSHKRKCYLLPDVTSLCTRTILTVGEGLANCVVEIKKVQAPPLSRGEIWDGQKWLWVISFGFSSFVPLNRKCELPGWG